MTTRTFARAGAALLALAACTVGSLDAQLTLDAEMAPFVGGSFYLSDARAPFVITREDGAQMIVQEGELHDAPTFGFSAGVRVAERFGVEGMFAWMPTRVVAEASVPQRRRVADVSSWRYGVATLYHFPQRGPVQPFAGLAVTSETLSYEPHLAWQRETDTAASLALGAHLPLSERLSVRLQALQDVIGRSEHSRREQLMVTAGVSYRQPVR